METPLPQLAGNLAPVVAPARDDTPPVSHTRPNPTPAPHTKAGASTIATPEPFVRIFMMIWTARYLLRGFFMELFDTRAPSWIKKPADSIITGGGFLRRHVRRIETAMNAHPELMAEMKHQLASQGSIDKKIPAPLYDSLRTTLHHWRGDASAQAAKIIEGARLEKGLYRLNETSHGAMKNTIRNRLGYMLYSGALFLGSTALTLNYSRKVRTDIDHLFRETVALEKSVSPDQVSFADIAKSDNVLVRHTVENYRNKRNGRLFSDGLLLAVTPLKSMAVTDMVLGWKGWQMFRDTRHRNPTMFEDLITFVNNKINPTNGLGQPITMGEVFDLYQHYAQTYAPKDAFVGVIEHEQSEGARWAENQTIFQRMTELLNKTYAYKHQSIVDPKTGLTVLQADFPLPKFMYLLGHDLIDVHRPQQTLVTVELANRHGISAVKDMQRMLGEGKTLDAVMARFNLTLPQPETPAVDATNGVLAKPHGTQLDGQVHPPALSATEASLAAPQPTIDVRSLHHDRSAQVNPVHAV